MTRTTVALRVVVAVLLVSALAAAGALAFENGGTPAPGRAAAETAPLPPAADGGIDAPTTVTIPPDPSIPPTAATVPVAAVPPPSGPATASPGTAKVVISPHGVVTTVLGAQGSGWLVKTPCGNTATLATGQPVSTATVVLDPGHGGDEPGATAPDNSLSEKTLNLAVARQAQHALELDGYTVLLTRPIDYRMTLESRAAVVNALKPRAFLSIHHNAAPNNTRDTPGTEAYYQHASADSKRLAGLVYEEVFRALSNFHPGWVGFDNAGVKVRLGSSGDDYYGVLRQTHGTPAALAELAYITNQNEADLLRTPAMQQVEGEAVARGIERYLTTNDPGSGFVAASTRSSPAGPGGGGQGCVDPRL